MRASPQALAAVRAVKLGKQWIPDEVIDYMLSHRAINHYCAAVLFEARRKRK